MTSATATATTETLSSASHSHSPNRNHGDGTSLVANPKHGREEEEEVAVTVTVTVVDTETDTFTPPKRASDTSENAAAAARVQEPVVVRKWKIDTEGGVEEDDEENADASVTIQSPLEKYLSATGAETVVPLPPPPSPLRTYAAVTGAALVQASPGGGGGGVGSVLSTSTLVTPPRKSTTGSTTTTITSTTTAVAATTTTPARGKRGESASPASASWRLERKTPGSAASALGSANSTTSTPLSPIPTLSFTSPISLRKSPVNIDIHSQNASGTTETSNLAAKNSASPTRRSLPCSSPNAAATGTTTPTRSKVAAFWAAKQQERQNGQKNSPLGTAAVSSSSWSPSSKVSVSSSLAASTPSASPDRMKKIASHQQQSPASPLKKLQQHSTQTSASSNSDNSGSGISRVTAFWATKQQEQNESIATTGTTKVSSPLSASSQSRSASSGVVSMTNSTETKPSSTPSSSPSKHTTTTPQRWQPATASRTQSVNNPSPSIHSSWSTPPRNSSVNQWSSLVKTTSPPPRVPKTTLSPTGSLTNVGSMFPYTHPQQAPPKTVTTTSTPPPTPPRNAVSTPPFTLKGAQSTTLPPSFSPSPSSSLPPCSLSTSSSSSSSPNAASPPQSESPGTDSSPSLPSPLSSPDSPEETTPSTRLPDASEITETSSCTSHMGGSNQIAVRPKQLFAMDSDQSPSNQDSPAAPTTTAPSSSSDPISTTHSENLEAEKCYHDDGDADQNNESSSGDETQNEFLGNQLDAILKKDYDRERASHTATDSSVERSLAEKQGNQQHAPPASQPVKNNAADSQDQEDDTEDDHQSQDSSKMTIGSGDSKDSSSVTTGNVLKIIEALDRIVGKDVTTNKKQKGAKPKKHNESSMSSGSSILSTTTSAAHSKGTPSVPVSPSSRAGSSSPRTKQKQQQQQQPVESTSTVMNEPASDVEKQDAVKSVSTAVQGPAGNISTSDNDIKPAEENNQNCRDSATAFDSKIRQETQNETEQTKEYTGTPEVTDEADNHSQISDEDVFEGLIPPETTEISASAPSMSDVALRAEQATASSRSVYADSSVDTSMIETEDDTLETSGIEESGYCYETDTQGDADTSKEEEIEEFMSRVIESEFGIPLPSTSALNVDAFSLSAAVMDLKRLGAEAAAQFTDKELIESLQAESDSDEEVAAGKDCVMKMPGGKIAYFRGRNDDQDSTRSPVLSTFSAPSAFSDPPSTTTDIVSNLSGMKNQSSDGYNRGRNQTPTSASSLGRGDTDATKKSDDASASSQSNLKRSKKRTNARGPHVKPADLKRCHSKKEPTEQSNVGTSLGPCSEGGTASDDDSCDSSCSSDYESFDSRQDNIDTSIVRAFFDFLDPNSNANGNGNEEDSTFSVGTDSVGPQLIGTASSDGKKGKGKLGFDFSSVGSFVASFMAVKPGKKKKNKKPRPDHAEPAGEEDIKNVYGTGYLDSTFFQDLWKEMSSSERDSPPTCDQFTRFTLCGYMERVDDPIRRVPSTVSVDEVKIAGFLNAIFPNGDPPEVIQQKAQLVLNQCREKFPGLYKRLVDRLDQAARKKGHEILKETKKVMDPVLELEEYEDEDQDSDDDVIEEVYPKTERAGKSERGTAEQSTINDSHCESFAASSEASAYGTSTLPSSYGSRYDSIEGLATGLAIANNCSSLRTSLPVQMPYVDLRPTNRLSTAIPVPEKDTSLVIDDVQMQSHEMDAEESAWLTFCKSPCQREAPLSPDVGIELTLENADDLSKDPDENAVSRTVGDMPIGIAVPSRMSHKFLQDRNRPRCASPGDVLPRSRTVSSLKPLITREQSRLNFDSQKQTEPNTKTVMIVGEKELKEHTEPRLCTDSQTSKAQVQLTPTVEKNLLVDEKISGSGLVQNELLFDEGKQRPNSALPMINSFLARTAYNKTIASKMKQYEAGSQTRTANEVDCSRKSPVSGEDALKSAKQRSTSSADMLSRETTSRKANPSHGILESVSHFDADCHGPHESSSENPLALSDGESDDSNDERRQEAEYAECDTVSADDSLKLLYRDSQGQRVLLSVLTSGMRKVGQVAEAKVSPNSEKGVPDSATRKSAGDSLQQSQCDPARFSESTSVARCSSDRQILKTCGEGQEQSATHVTRSFFPKALSRDEPKHIVAGRHSVSDLQRIGVTNQGQSSSYVSESLSLTTPTKRSSGAHKERLAANVHTSKLGTPRTKGQASKATEEPLAAASGFPETPKTSNTRLVSQSKKSYCEGARPLLASKDSEWVEFETLRYADFLHSQTAHSSKTQRTEPMTSLEPKSHRMLDPHAADRYSRNHLDKPAQDPPGKMILSSLKDTAKSMPRARYQRLFSSQSEEEASLMTPASKSVPLFEDELSSAQQWEDFQPLEVFKQIDWGSATPAQKSKVSREMPKHQLQIGKKPHGRRRSPLQHDPKKSSPNCVASLPLNSATKAAAEARAAELYPPSVLDFEQFGNMAEF